MIRSALQEARVVIELAGPEETRALGMVLGELAEPGDIITLCGDLGAGKTFLTQAIGRGLGVPVSCYITSPTFSLVHEYPGRLPLCHLDLYRLAGAEEIEAAGLTDYLYREGVAVVEWADRLGYLMPRERLEIGLALTGPESRRATLAAFGESWRRRLTAIEVKVTT